MKKFNYSTSAIEVIKFILDNEDKARQSVKRKKHFPNTWGGVNAFTKALVKELLGMLDMPYTKELGSFVRETIEDIHMPSSSRYYVGLSLEEALWGCRIFEKEEKLIGFSLEEIKQGKRFTTK